MSRGIFTEYRQRPGQMTPAAALPLFRTVDGAELADIQRTREFNSGPSGFGEKQFWLSHAAARSYAATLHSLGYGDQTVVKTTVSSRTASLGHRMVLDQRSAISFPLAALAAINADAASGGILVLGRNGA